MSFAFIDIHHHILYGVDDGPGSCLEMFNMIKAAYADGVRTIIATPHISLNVEPFRLESLKAKVNEAIWFCESNGYDLDIRLGSEILYTVYSERLLQERRIPTLAGSNKVLLEFPEKIGYEELEDAIFTTLRSGLIPILAHIERYHKIIFAPKKLFQLKEKHQVFFQIDADCILNERKYATYRAVKQLLSKGLIDYVASDAHDTDKRKCNMSAAYRKLVDMFDEEYADQLTCNHFSIDDFINA